MERPDASDRRPARRPGPDPDPALFLHWPRAQRGPGQWRLRLDMFAPPCAVAPPDLRAALSAYPCRKDAPGGPPSPDEIPDDLLTTAARCGAVTSPAFLDILDGGCFTRTPCLCCYAARSAAAAREAADALRLFLKYYNAKSYVESLAFARLVATLSRDLTAEEANSVREAIATLDSTPDIVRAINSAEGLCVALPPCEPGVVWVYSTPEGRRLLRSLARDLRREGAPVRVVVASSSEGVFPRFRYRLYAASLQRPGGPSREDAILILEAAKVWARARSGGGGKGERRPRARRRARAEKTEETPPEGCSTEERQVHPRAI